MQGIYRLPPRGSSHVHALRCGRHNRIRLCRALIKPNHAPRTARSGAQHIPQASKKYSPETEAGTQQLAAEVARALREATKAEQQRSRGATFATVTHIMVLSAIAVFAVMCNVPAIIRDATSASEALSKISPMVVKNIGATEWDLVTLRKAAFFTMGFEFLNPLVFSLFHANIFHLWVSSSALHTAGYAIESVIGSSRFMVIAGVAAFFAYQTNLQVIGEPVMGLSGMASGLMGAAFALSAWRPQVQPALRQLFGNALWLAGLGLVLPCIDHRVHVIGFMAGAASAVLVSILPPLHLPLLAVASSLSTWALMFLCAFGVMRHVFRVI